MFLLLCDRFVHSLFTMFVVESIRLCSVVNSDKVCIAMLLSNRNHEFCKDDFDVETVFWSVFGGNRSYYWSFINEENPQWRSGGFSNHEKSWNWRRRSENEYNGTSTEPESDCSHSDLISDRLALGLGASGPLKLEDVKNVQVLLQFLFNVILNYFLSSFSLPLQCDIVQFYETRYRICALKWHPDRHHGSFKVIAEEKLKHCSAAYRPLSDKLALD
ncbi:hypothetical protein JHK86_024837 [Glycine max]|nr:hypothetical protein JHK86_024837 [Glycine max]